MNNRDGALSFEAEFNNERFNGAVEESKRRVQGFSQATVKEGEKIDDAFKITAENIRIQKDVIAQIETQIKQLNKQIDATAPGMAQNDLRKQSALLTQELNGEKSALTMLEQQVKETEAAHVTFRTQIRNVREELIAMEVAGKRGTAEYEALQQKAGKLNDAYKDAQKQMNVLANDERGFQGIMSAMSGITGAFSAAQGAVGLFTGENENLNRIMLRVQSLMAVTIGLQQVSQTLNKDSYFSVVILTKAKEMLAMAEMKLATAFGISTAAARVFFASITLGLSAAITGLIIVVSKLISKQREAAKAQQEMNKAVAESAYKSLAEFERLRVGWERLGNSFKDKKQFIKDNAEAFKSLGVESQNVSDIEDVLIRKSEAFRNSLLARAKSVAIMEVAAEKYKQAFEKMLEADAMPATKTKYQTGGFMGQGGLETYQVENKEKTKLKDEAAKLLKEFEDLVKQSVLEMEKANELISKMNTKNIQTLVAGSIGAIEEAIKQKKEALKKITNPADYEKAIKEIMLLEEKLDKIRGRTTLQPLKGKMIESDGVTFSKKIEKQLHELDLLRLAEIEYQNVQSLTTKQLKEYIEELKRKYQLVKNINTEEGKKKQEEVVKEISDSEKAMNDQRLAYLDGLSGILQQIDSGLASWVNEIGTVVDSMSVLNSSTAAQSEKIKANISLFSVMVSVFQQMFQGVGNSEENIADLEQAYKSFQELLKAQMRLIDEMTGVEKINASNKALKEYDKTISDILNKKKVWEIGGSKKTLTDILGGGDLSDPEVYKRLLEYRSKVEANLQNARTDKNYRKYEEFELANLNLIDQLLESYEARKQLINSFYEDITGSNAQTISDTIRDGFADGMRSVDDFSENMKEVIRKALIESFQAKYLDSQLQSWFESFGEAAADGTLTKEEIEANKAAFKTILENAGIAWEEYEKMMEETGIAVSKSTSKTALTGAIKGVSEETASIVAGQMNAIRINQSESLAVVRNQLMHLSNIDRNTRYLELLPRLIDLLGGTSINSSRSRGINR